MVVIFGDVRHKDELMSDLEGMQDEFDAYYYGKKGWMILDSDRGGGLISGKRKCSSLSYSIVGEDFDSSGYSVARGHGHIFASERFKRALFGQNWRKRKEFCG